MTILLISGGIILLILLTIWSIYNRLVSAKNRVEEAYSGIDIQLKKRFELIPNLIEAVKGYNAYEAETLMQIVERRNPSGNTIDEMKTNDTSITGALRTFRVHVEDYPDLKANTQFLQLMENLSTVENELAMARRYYNGTTRDLNTKLQVFPAVVVARSLGFEKMPFYEIDEQQKTAPTVDLNS